MLFSLQKHLSDGKLHLEYGCSYIYVDFFAIID